MAYAPLPRDPHLPPPQNGLGTAAGKPTGKVNDSEEAPEQEREQGRHRGGSAQGRGGREGKSRERCLQGEPEQRPGREPAVL